MRNRQRDAAQIAEKKARIVEVSFRMFARRGIDAVTMPEIAEANGVARASLYRYFATKLDLAVAVSARMWGEVLRDNDIERLRSDHSAAMLYEHFLDRFLFLYRNHGDLLRFNQSFNAFVAKEGASSDQMRPFGEVIEMIAARFHGVYVLGMADGTLKTEIPENEMFSATLHLMLAATTHYAVGLIYHGGIKPIRELELLKSMLLERYVSPTSPDIIGQI